ncbi:MAG: homoserine dehydrogenase, partial [Acidimicrobiia bacterium]|nr:homoserine dehydrogenase [Acidimicrobiia bacterium]
MEANVVRVGLLGCGTVGASLVQLIAEHGDTIAARSGARLEVVRVAVHDLSKPRAVTLADGVLTDDPGSLVIDSDVDVVVELMGGLDPAYRLIRTALEGGKPVVTANKEVVARSGAELVQVAAKAGVDLLYEAAVAGAIPLLRPLRESLAGDRLQRVMGIVNGTTNFILTRMSDTGASFAQALGEAEGLGYT